MNATPAQGLKYLVVEGPIGVGKTALAAKLAERLHSTPLLESGEENPFLEQFYADRQRSALPAQLFFLLQRAPQIEALQQDDLFAPVRVADFLITRDRLFAELNLNAAELALYEQVFSHLDLKPPAPDLVIYLQAPTDVLRARVARRSPSLARQLDDGYLERVAEAYSRFFYDYDDSPLLIVNAASFDPVNNTADFEALFEQIGNARRGRHFFNPVAAAMA